MNWEQRAEYKKNKVNANIPKHWILSEVPSASEEPNGLEYLNRILPSEEVEITNSTAVKLIEQLSKGERTAYDVTYAFCHRAALLHQLCNNLAEIFFDDALERAKSLDKIFKETGKPVGKLHGMPISLKDQVNLEGLDSCMGFTAYIDQPKTKDEVSLLAETLYNEGAVFYVKTTVPTSMMSVECYSHIYGHTLNSINRKVSCGGSSGGEGSLIGGRGSVIGFGTDIGGSIRIPSCFQGLYGLKGTTERISYLNVSNTLVNNPLISSAIGPMCCHLEDLEMITQVLVDSKAWEIDSKMPPIEWRSVSIPKKLKVGVIRQNGDIHGHPAVYRAVDEVEKALTANGHELIQLDDEVLPMKYSEMMDLISRAYCITGYADIKESFKKGNEPLTNLISHVDERQSEDITEEWKVSGLKYQCQVAFNRFLKEKGIDCIISPIWAETSYTPGKHNWKLSMCGVFNLLDYSCITLPVTKVKASDTYPKDFNPGNDTTKEVFESFDIDTYIGTPVCLQIAGKKYEEEKVIELCKLFKSYL